MPIFQQFILIFSFSVKPSLLLSSIHTIPLFYGSSSTLFYKLQYQARLFRTQEITSSFHYNQIASTLSMFTIEQVGASLNFIPIKKALSNQLTTKLSGFSNNSSLIIHQLKNDSKLSCPSKKHQKTIYQKEQEIVKRRKNDYVRKVIFENQELTKKIRNLQEINNNIQAINEELQNRFIQLMRDFHNLKQKYRSLVSNKQFQLPDQLIEREPENPDLFTQLLRRISQSSNLQTKKDLDVSDLYMKKNSLKSEAVLKTEPCYCQEQQQQFLAKRRRQTIFTFKKSNSFRYSSQVYTQTQNSFCQIFDSCLKDGSKGQCGLLSKIDSYEIDPKQIQREKDEVQKRFEQVMLITKNV